MSIAVRPPEGPGIDPLPPGTVALVGAGPGDPELLTLKAVRMIAAADVILVDDLVDPAVLAHARPGVRITAVGKRGGCPSTPQAFIERLMVREARAGARVVRLKGGDPLVFGRAGEELEALRAADVPFTIVNGITSALAAAAALGVSLTHRDHSHGVALVTGHPAADGPPSQRDQAAWRAMIGAGLTVAVYMGLSRLADWQASLVAAGVDPATPAACIAGAGRPGETTLVTTLDRLADAVSAAAMTSPALLLLGRAAASGSRPERVRSVRPTGLAQALPDR